MARKAAKTVDVEVKCLACKQVSSIRNFRVATIEPLRYIDFCGTCEDKYGTAMLYKTHADVNDMVRSCVLAAARKSPTRRTQDEIRLLHEPKRKKAAPHEYIKPEDLPEEVKREMAERELARRHLIPFVKRFAPDYDPGWVHHDLARHLEQFLRDVIDGLSPRLMIFMPPRLGKSTLASDNFVSWALGLFPWLEFIIASHSITLPEQFSRNNKDRIQSKEYQQLFPDTVIRRDVQSTDLWATTAGGKFVAAGIGTGIYGKGAHIAVVDDPIKDQQEAMSSVVRQNAWDWFTVTLGSRIAPGGGILLIQTRWHDDDVAGRAERMMMEAMEEGVAEGEFDKYKIVSYPALAEHDQYLLPNKTINAEKLEEVPEGARLLRKEGDALHPARYSREAMLRRKNTMLPSFWNAVYQQNPVPDEGEIFTKAMLPTEPALTPEALSTMKILFAGDLAQGEKKVNDWSVFSVGALDVNDYLHVLYMWRARAQTPAIIRRFIEVLKEFGVHQYGFEVDRPWMAIKPLVDIEIQKARLGVAYYDKMVPIQDKTVRATPLQSRAQFGKILFREKSPWYDKMVAELIRFPAGLHDDHVDSLAWLARLALDVRPPTALSHSRAKPASWMDELNDTTQSKHFMAA